LGVDIMNKLIERYTTQWRTNRWSLVFLYILDIAELASYIIYTENINGQRIKNWKALI